MESLGAIVDRDNLEEGIERDHDDNTVDEDQIIKWFS